MAARATGWAQRRCHTITNPTAIMGLNGYVPALGGSNTGSLASNGAFEVSAGSSITVRYGYQQTGSDPVQTTSATNTTTLTCSVFYETSQNLWEAAATATQTLAGGQPTAQTFDLTFTPTHSGTVRIFVRMQVKVTATSTVISDVNTDAANFGSPAEVLPATAAFDDFTPGLVRAGTTLSSFAQSGGNGSGVFATYPKLIVNTLTTGHAPRSAEASETYTITWKRTATTFGTTTVAASTSLTPAGTGLTVDNTWPVAAFSPDLVLDPASSALSTANSGAALPWVHWTSVPSTPGTVTRTDDAAGNAISLKFAAAFTADPRITMQFYMQLNTATVNTPPDGVSDLTHNVPDKTSSDVGEVTHRCKDANGAGINGLNFTAGSVTLTDVGSLVAAEVRKGSTLATATLNGATGWLVGSGALSGASPNLLPWPDVNPGGTWNYNWTISTANATGLDTPSSPIATSIQSQNPHVHVAAFLNGIGTAPGGSRHVKPGDTLKLIATATDELDGKRLIASAGTVWITHFNGSAAQLEVLISDTDNTSAAFAAWPAGTARTQFSLAPDTDTTQMVKTFSNTAGWGNWPLVVRVNLTVAGVDYPTYFYRELPGSKNAHDSYAFDGVDFATGLPFR